MRFEHSAVVDGGPDTVFSVTQDYARRLEWDPDREMFPGDDQANALLDRPRRPGWELPNL